MKKTSLVGFPTHRSLFHASILKKILCTMQGCHNRRRGAHHRHPWGGGWEMVTRMSSYGEGSTQRSTDREQKGTPTPSSPLRPNECRVIRFNGVANYVLIHKFSHARQEGGKSEEISIVTQFEEGQIDPEPKYSVSEQITSVRRPNRKKGSDERVGVNFRRKRAATRVNEP